MNRIGHSISQWYALIDYCLKEDYQRQLCTETYVKKEQFRSIYLDKSDLIQKLKQFPLLLDSFGRWHKPCDVSLSFFERMREI